MNTVDDTDPPQRGGPRGRGAYLWVIDQLPDQHEEKMRSTATAVRNVRLRIRLTRERWVRRFRRRMRNTVRAASRWMRSTRDSLENRYARQDGHPADTPAYSNDAGDVEPTWTPSGRLAKLVMPPLVQLPGDGDMVAIDATGVHVDDIIGCQSRLPERCIVVTDSPSLGLLRQAGIAYEYLPSAAGAYPSETFRHRLPWLDMVYGIDRIEVFASTANRAAHAADRPAERTTGWRSVFSLAPVYRSAQRLIGADSFRQTLVSDILDLDADDRVIDIGCGTADILEYLPARDYIGFDPSQRYVADARARFGDRGTFVTATADHFESAGADRTMAMAIGVLHHMDDHAVAELFQLAHSVLEPGGRLVTIDPALTPDQHRVARLLVSRDRGQHVREPEHLMRLVSPIFPNAQIEVRHDLLRPPYTHAIIRASRES